MPLPPRSLPHSHPQPQSDMNLPAWKPLEPLGCLFLSPWSQDTQVPSCLPCTPQTGSATQAGTVLVQLCTNAWLRDGHPAGTHVSAECKRVRRWQEAGAAPGKQGSPRSPAPRRARLVPGGPVLCYKLLELKEGAILGLRVSGRLHGEARESECRVSPSVPGLGGKGGGHSGQGAAFCKGWR